MICIVTARTNWPPSPLCTFRQQSSSPGSPPSNCYIHFIHFFTILLTHFRQLTLFFPHFWLQTLWSRFRLQKMEEIPFETTFPSTILEGSTTTVSGITSTTPEVYAEYEECYNDPMFTIFTYTVGSQTSFVEI